MDPQKATFCAFAVAITILVLSPASAEIDLANDSVVQKLLKEGDAAARAAELEMNTAGDSEEVETPEDILLRQQSPDDVVPEMVQQIEVKEVSDRASDAEIDTKAEVERSIRAAVQLQMSSAIRTAVSETIHAAKAKASSTEQLRMAVMSSAQKAAKKAAAQVGIPLVANSAKTEAIIIAKRSGKAAAQKAAAAGKSVSEQARVARVTAARVATAFAQMAHKIGVRVAHEEAAKQESKAGSAAILQLGSIRVPKKAHKIAPLVTTATSAKVTAKPGTAETAKRIADVADKGIKQGVADTKAVARKVAKADGLGASQTAHLEKQATVAVKRAAMRLPGANPYSQPATTGYSATTTGYGATPTHRVSVAAAADKAKEKAKKRVLSRFRREAAAEKKKVRAALENAAKAQRKATSLVSSTAKKSLARGLDKGLSTRNLKTASEKATKASGKVEKAVKDAIGKALRQKQRLRRADEKVSKAGENATKEAHRKNIRQRANAKTLKKTRERLLKKQKAERSTKKQRANEIAHKAIAKVVHVTGNSVSKKKARALAAQVQKTYLADVCYNAVQHKMRLISAQTKSSSPTLKGAALVRAQVNALKAAQKGIINFIVQQSMRRNSRLAAAQAKAAAAARGMSPQIQLRKARLAWKATSPQIRTYCEPAAKKAAAAEIAAPGTARTKMTSHRFVDKCKRVMETQIKKACFKATGPLVLAGATKAAKHDADYKWQVSEGKKEEKKVCQANAQLYAGNAEKQCTGMVQRTLARKAANGQKSFQFAQELREKVKAKLQRTTETAVKKATEKIVKRCAKAKAKAAKRARAEASRKAISEEIARHSEAAGKAAKDKAYKTAIQDGLTAKHARKLGAEAYKRVKAESLAKATAALHGLAPAAPTAATAVDIQMTQLQEELEEGKRTHEAQTTKLIDSALALAQSSSH
jgi:hypothetical protein